MDYMKKQLYQKKTKKQFNKQFKKHNKLNITLNNELNNSTNNSKIKMIGGGNAPMDLQSLTAQDIQALMQQGIMPEQIVELAQQQGQPVPPIIAEMLGQGPGAPPGMPPGMGMEGMPPPNTKTGKFPAMMDLPTYAQYRGVEKMEQKQKLKFGAHKPQVFGYVFSDLISEDILRDMKRTQGGFLIGVNLNNLFNTLRDVIKADEKGEQIKKIKNSNEIFKRVGEHVNVDFDKILDTKMGYRGSDFPMLPEQELNEYSSLEEIINESKKYADMGLNGQITPFGLLIMTRMLYKYRKNNAQWIRVATVLELIYKYLGDNNSREGFFKERKEIPIKSLMELEEFYNTDHIFMTETELHKFKKNLDFYKFDPKIDIKKQIKELLSKAPPII
jgi:hypothetical protein